MLINDLKVAWRNLRKHKFFSLLNITGLALAMSVCLVVIMVIRDQLDYDLWHLFPERTFRVDTEAQRKEGGVEKYASTTYPLGGTLQNDYAITEAVVCLSRGPNGDAIGAGKTLAVEGFFTNPSFFRVFGFELAAGDPGTALNAPFSIILSQSTAEKFFGQENPLDKTLTFKGYGSFKITGVLKKNPGKTHLEFDVLASGSSLPAIEKAYPPEEKEFAVLDNWTNYYASYLYVLLQKGKTKSDLDAALAEISATRYQNLTLETRDAGYRFYAQNLLNITPAPDLLSNNLGRGIPMLVLWALLGFVLLLIIFPCLNYANLTIARALTRAKEIGIRKVVGARRPALIRQFLTEAVLTSVLAFGLAWCIKFFLIAYLQKNLFIDLLSVESRTQMQHDDWLTWLLFGSFALVVGLVAGLLPAFYLAGFRPADTLRDSGGRRLFSRLNLRKALIVLQFAISLVFIIVVSSMRRQMDYTLAANYGFNKENIINIDLQGQPVDRLATEIARDHRVLQVSAISHPIGTWSDSDTDIRRTKDAEPITIRDYAIDRNFLDNHGLALVAGENFPAEASPVRQRYVIFNEKALEILNLGSPKDAIGKTVWFNDSTEVRVQGVVQDFHFRPMTDVVGPLVLRYAPQELHYLNVRAIPGEPSGVLSMLSSLWKQTDANHPFEYT
ncbi:MAG: ABC transporter permease, partial [Saprospiraceae bacterium]